jgi:hypothetical protein
MSLWIACAAASASSVSKVAVLARSDTEVGDGQRRLKEAEEHEYQSPERATR